jgi:hypothetical protein
VLRKRRNSDSSIENESDHPQRNIGTSRSAVYDRKAREAFRNGTFVGYDKTRHHLSRECLDITRIIIEGYFSLLIIYRDHLPGNLTPFLPWLHSSEACEHTFGCCRCLVKDFTYLDFLYMIPKLRISLRRAVLRSRTSDSKARASGYNHTYFDNRDLDAFALSTLPTTDDMAALSQTARDEADMLVTACGVDINRLRLLGNLLARGGPRLPSLDAWFVGTGIEGEDDDSDGFSDAASIGEAEQLQDLLDHVGSDDFTKTASKAQKKQAERLSFAAAALVAEDHRKVYTPFIICSRLCSDFILVKSLLRPLPRRQRPRTNCLPRRSGSWINIWLRFHRRW